MGRDCERVVKESSRSCMYSHVCPVQIASRKLGLGSTKREEWREIFKRDCTNVITLLVST